MIVNREKYNELILAIYLFLFILLRIFTTTFRSMSTIILFSSVSVLLLASFMHNKGRINKVFGLFLITAIVFWVSQLLFYFNGYTIHYLYYFIIYGFMTIYFFTQIRDVSVFLVQYSKISIIAFFILLLDPLMNFRFSATYMTFGTALLPVFCGLVIGWLYSNKLHYLLFTIASFLMLLFFANRSAILTATIFLVAAYFYLKKPEKFEYRKKAKLGLAIGILLVTMFILLINLNPILVLLNERFMIPNGYSSYSLNTLIRFTTNWNFSAEYSSRGVVQEEALNYIFNNNLVLGNGIGSFHNYYGAFSHNYLIDIMNGLGIIGIVGFFVLLINSLRSFIRSDKDQGLFFILMFCLSMIPLTFSSTYIETGEFWILLFYGLLYPGFKKLGLDNQN